MEKHYLEPDSFKITKFCKQKEESDTNKLKIHYINSGTNVELNVIQKLLSS